MRDIKDLIGKQKKKPDPNHLSDEEFTRKMYLEDIARIHSFNKEFERMRWPKPIGPLWKN